VTGVQTCALPIYYTKLGSRRSDVLEYLDTAAAIGFDPREPLGNFMNG